MILKEETQLLDPAVRKKIIEDIKSTENQQRKAEVYKRYQCYKDKTYLYVRDLLLRQFDASTVSEMSYALSNLGIVRKVIDKLARVYKYGVEREVYIDDQEDEEATKNLEIASKECDANSNLKKANRFFKLFKNVSVYVRPTKASEDKMDIKVTPLAPYLYDVIEYAHQREKPMCFILSSYKPSVSAGAATSLAVVPGTDGRGGKTIGYQVPQGDGIDQTIADTPGDEESSGYIFWSNNYHFVCDEKGNIIAGPEDLLNPIGRIPFVNYAEDQDGSFWALGGDDLTDGGILINSMITNINHIAITQGYGQLVLTGKDLPKTIKVGPNKAIRLVHEGEDPVPTFDFKSANPPLDQLRSLVEMYVALLLTTNNLSTSGVASSLNGAGSFPSGIAMLIDKSESMEDVEDQRQVFVDNEPIIWDLYSKWHSLLKSKNELVEPLQNISLPESFDLKVKFGTPKVIETDKERLEVLKLKMDMKLMSLRDALKAEYPDLSDEQADNKLKEILEESMVKTAKSLVKEDEAEDTEEVEDASQGEQGNLEQDDSGN